jgi:hypothetical protein
MIIFEDLPVEISFIINDFLQELLELEEAQRMEGILAAFDIGIEKKVSIYFINGGGDECCFFNEKNQKIEDVQGLYSAKEVIFANSETWPKDNEQVLERFSDILILKGKPLLWSQLLVRYRTGRHYLFKDEYSLRVWGATDISLMTHGTAFLS